MMADMQRARLLAGELPAHGWNVEILAPDLRFQTDFSMTQGEGVKFPAVPVHSAEPWRPEVFERIGSRNIGIRASLPIRKSGAKLCRSGDFQLVYFTTTQHWLTCQGAAWRKSAGIPYVADLHDPIYLEKKVYFVSRHRMKERVARWMGKTVERLSIGRADGVVSVSQGYIDEVARRNPRAPWCTTSATLVQPFPADLAGLAAVDSLRRPESGRKRVVYVGAGGNIMQKGWTELVDTLGGLEKSKLPLFELHGTDTDWRAKKGLFLQAVAEARGLAGAAREFPARISYGESLSLTKASDGLLVLGVDDPNYRPSKLNTCLATGLPLLALVHAQSKLRCELESAGPGVHVYTFGSGGSADRQNSIAVRRFLDEVASGSTWRFRDRAVLSPQTAAAAHAELFDRILAQQRFRRLRRHGANRTE